MIKIHKQNKIHYFTCIIVITLFMFFCNDKNIIKADEKELKDITNVASVPEEQPAEEQLPTEDTSPLQGLTFNFPVEMYNYFIAETSFIEGMQEYDIILKNCHTQGAKRYIMKYNPYFTEEDWNNMSIYDVYVYTYCYQEYQRISNNSKIESIADIEYALSTDKYLLDGCPDGDKVYNAILTVLSYQWEYEMYTGEVLNIYDPLKEGTIDIYIEDNYAVDETVSTEEVQPDETETEEVTTSETATKIEDVTTPKDNLKKDVKETVVRYILTLCILSAAAIGIAIIAIKKKKSNIQ